MVGFSVLPATSDEDSGSQRQWLGHAAVKGPRWARMSLITCCLLGLQMTWAVEQSYASPYLLELGLSKSLMSIVFVAGPLSGLVVQPIIGVFADHSKSRWGRRRPYMLAGCVISVGALILLGFTRDFTAIAVDVSSRAGNLVTVGLAVWSIYCLDFSINAVQATDRALLVDTLPAAEQELGNAWAARLSGVGNMLGFFAGEIDLVRIFPFLGRTQLEVLVITASVILIATHLLTCMCVSERVLLRDSESSPSGGLLASLRTIWQNIWTLPPTIRQICIIQFFNWIAWFPILFFSSTWVGEIYTRGELSHGRTNDDAAAIAEEARRVGSQALFYNAAVSLAATILLPILLSAVGREIFRRDLRASGSESRWGFLMPTWALAVFTLPYLWALSHLLFAIMMFLTFVTTTVWAASAIIAVLGLSSAISQWAPFSLLGEAIQAESHSLEDVVVLSERHDLENSVGIEQQALISASEDAEEPETIEAVEAELQVQKGTPSPSPEEGFDTSGAVLHVEHGVTPNGHFTPKTSSIADKAGIILGIHNIFVVVPQFLVTGFSAVIFAILEPDRSVIHASPSVPTTVNGTMTVATPGVSEPRSYDSIGVVMRIGGLSALVACYFTYRLARQLG